MKPQTLQDWLVQLENLHPVEMDLGLERIRAVATNLGWGPTWKPAAQVVTIAGTNGKGSTLGLLEALLVEAGLRVGSYSSPHLLRYNERVRINGIPVEDPAFCDAFEQVERARNGISLTYFEFGTLAAFHIIADRQVDVALLEIGLGGRLDAVNLIDPSLAIITGVAMDHMQWLGDSREAIGTEKAGILRAHVPAVIGDPDPPKSLIAATGQVKAQVAFADVDFGVTETDAQLLRWWGRCPDQQAVEIGDLPVGAVHPRAIASALQALQFMQFEQITPELIRTVLGTCQVPGRCQQFTLRGQRIVVDVSHNPQAAQHLAENLRSLDASIKGPGKRRALIGMLRDKAIAGTIAPLLDWADEWHCIGTPGARGLQASTLAEEVRKCTGKPVLTVPDSPSALHDLLLQGRPGDALAGFGSFSLAGRLIQTIAEIRNS